jgi:ketosteroid isomerase-like protein
MKKILTYGFYAMLGISTALGQSNNNQKESPPQPSQIDNRTVEQQIIEIEHQWSQAFIKHDPTVFYRHVVDDYVGIYPTRKLTKADLIAETKGVGSRTLVSVDPTTSTVRVFDKTAIVTGHAVYRMREKSGEKTVVRTLYTEVFILKDGRWQCVAGHYTPFASPE